MKFISWNVNGIRAVHNKDLFMPFIKKHDPDILCLQETKAEQGQSPIDLPQYEEYWHSATKKGYSGTAIFTKIKPISVILGFHEKLLKKYNLKDKYGDANLEGRVITLEFKEFYLVNVYTPNSKDDLSRLEFRYNNWDKAFITHCEILETMKPVIFCGDLNVAHTEIDLARPKENDGKHGFTKEEREGVDNIIKAGFIDSFRVFNKDPNNYTWWTAWGGARTRNVGWRIDYFFVSKKIENKLKNAQILANVMGSDHCPISLELSITN